MTTAGRGRYNRAESRFDRAAAQRRRLFEAAAAALERQGAMALTVDRVLAGAPMGRNTFYKHFSHVNALVTGLVSHAEAEIFSAIDARCAGARTPREGLRAFALAWLEETAARRSLALALLVYGPAALPSARAGAGVSALSKRLGVLLEQARRDALTSVRPDPARVDAVASVLARLAVVALDAGDEQRHAFAELGVDLAVRAFR